MDDYLSMLLNPPGAVSVQAPDEYLRRSSVFKVSGNVTISSSLSKGHVLCQVYPQYITQAVPFLTWVGDNGAVHLDVTNYPAGLPTFNSTNGQALTNYYTFVRIVAFQVKLVYIGAVLNTAGELSIGIDNINQLTAGYNIKNNIQDGLIYARDMANDGFMCNWIPQDETDFEFRTPTTVAKSQFWGSITLAGTGFPVNTPVYDLSYTAIVEGLVIPSNQDFIPRTISQPLDRSEAMLTLKRRVLTNPGLIVCSSKGGSSSSVVYVKGSTETSRPSPIQVPKYNRFGPSEFNATPTGWMNPQSNTRKGADWLLNQGSILDYF